MTKTQIIPNEMQRVADRIATWRAERKRIEPMPDQFWSAAVELARHYGVGPTARGLKIDFGGLQRHLQRDSAQAESAGEHQQAPTLADAESPQDEPVQFIEIPVVAPSTTSTAGAETRVEVTRPDGCVMSMRLPSAGQFDLGVLIESFLGQAQ